MGQTDRQDRRTDCSSA